MKCSRELVFTFVLLATLTGCSVRPLSAPANTAELVLTHANVVDVEHGRVLADQTLFIAGNRIRDVQPSARARPLPGAQVVDVNGLYVIPGLWDMHAHVLENFEHHASLLLLNGITGVRHPGNSSLDSLRAVRSRIADARSDVLPRMIAAGVTIDGSPPVAANSVVLQRAEDAGRLVDSLVAGGVDHLKVYARLKREPFLALAAEARRRGLMVTGHIPNTVTAFEMSDAGARSIEHIFELPLACSSREADMRRLRASLEGTPQLRPARPAIMDTVLATYDRDKCRRLAAHLARNRTYVTPTLYLGRVQANGFRATARDSSVAEYFGGAIPTSPVAIPELSSPERARRVYSAYVEVLRLLHDAGVPLLAGSDTQAPLMWIGFSLHDELMTLVRDAGMTPADALRTATLNPARYFMAEDSMGSVRPGYVADLVLLESNPLDDIRNTRNVRGVVMNGTHLSSAALDARRRAAR